MKRLNRADVIDAVGLGRVLFAIGLVVVAAASLVIGFAVGAEAFPLRKGNCNGMEDVVFYYDDAEENWTSANKSNFLAGADNWDNLDDRNGNTVTDISEAPTGNAIPVYLRDGSGASVSCNIFGTVLKITMDKSYAAHDFRGVANHEVGHAHGFGHTSRLDSWDNDEATMSGCQFFGQLRDMKTFEQDDGGTFLATFDDLDLHANPSFEDQGAWTSDVWGVGGGATLVMRNNSSSGLGTWHAEIQDGGYIFQTMRVTDPHDIKAQFRYRKEASLDSGTATILLFGSELSYDVLPSSDPCHSSQWGGHKSLQCGLGHAQSQLPRLQG